MTLATLEFTPSAAAKVKQLIATESDDSLMLRVYIQGGGCSGFQYGFEFDKETEVDDIVVEQDGVKLLVDPMSMQYLMGSKLTYIEDLQGSRFVVENPNAATTCGCGSSFSM